MAEELQYPSRTDTKRKYEDQTTPPPPSTRRPTGFSAPISSFNAPDSTAGPPSSYNSVPPPVDDFQLAKQRAQEIAARLFSNASSAEAKRPRVENGGSNDGSNDLGQKTSGFQDGNALPVPYGFQGSTGYQGSGAYQGSAGYGSGSSKKIDIPNGRVGVIIGKGGETIKYLQLQSGAKIQVTRDMDADPNSPYRAVELMGSAEQISEAEKLIKSVLAEAEAGATGLAPKRFSVPTPGAEQFQMKVPNNKVGLIIGKGGETIKNMQSRSGARIQLVPLHPPPGDTSTERTVYIDGTQEQIEAAKELVNEVISENRVRNPGMGGGYSQQGFRPQSQPWAPPAQQPGYGYMQPGAYPGAPPQYAQPPYSGYPPQSTSTGWDQTPVAPTNQPTTPGGGYDYYNQQAPQPPPVGGTTPTDNTGYNYGQQPYGGPGYSQPPAAGQQPQGYGQDGYGGGGGYGAPAPAPAPGYAQPQQGYDQSYNSTPSYGAQATQEGTTPTYGAPPPSQVAPPPAQPTYGSQPPVTPPTYPTSGYPPSSQPGYGQPPPAVPASYAPPAVPASYAPPSQAQKAPASQAVYGHAPPPATSQAYVQSAAPTNSQPPQSGYAQPPYSVPPTTGQPSYGAQAYADPYGGGYTQPPVYGGGGDSTSVASGGQATGVVKASSQS